jgi:hypothetical protein
LDVGDLDKLVEKKIRHPKKNEIHVEIIIQDFLLETEQRIHIMHYKMRNVASEVNCNTFLTEKYENEN